MSENYKELLQKYDLLAKQYENLKTQYLTVLDLAKKKESEVKNESSDSSRN